MTQKKENTVFVLMAMNAILFVLIFLSVAYNYRLAADDLHYLVKSEQLGVWDAMLFYYHNWNPRWSATLVTNAVLRKFSTALPLYFVITLILGFVSVRSFVLNFTAGLKLPFTCSQQALISLYILAAIFYGSFSKDDTWFWITVNPMYLWGSFFALLGGSFLIGNTKPLIRLPIVAIAFLYVGGASETVAMATIVTLFYLGFLTHRDNSSLKIDTRTLHVATIFCLIGFGIDLFGSGAQIRYEHLPQYTFTDRLLVGFWNYVKFTLKEIPLTLPFVLVAASPFAYFGRKHLRFQLIALKELVLVNRKLWALADIIIILLAFALAFSMGELGPKRAWVPITFIVVAISIAFAYQLGTWLYIKTNGHLFKLVVSLQVLAIFYQGFTGIHQLQVTHQYAESVDERMLSISELPADQTLIELSPLSDSGWLFSAEISADSAHFTNRHLRIYDQNKHHFIVKRPVSSTP